MKESEKNVEKAAMIHLIISNEGAVHKETVKRWKDYSPCQGPSGVDDTERAQVHCFNLREVLQRELGLPGSEEGTP